LASRRLQSEVELNLASMLDMAFQLLFFFVITFSPPKPESQIAMRLPPAQVVATKGQGTEKAGSEDKPIKAKGLETLTITVYSRPNGDILSMARGGEEVPAGSPEQMFDQSVQNVAGRFAQRGLHFSSR